MHESSLPPRVNELEKDLHTLQHRVSVLEDTHKDTPHRLTRVELAVQRLPQIEAKLAEQGDLIKSGFSSVRGILIGVGLLWSMFQIGPQIVKFLGGS